MQTSSYPHQLSPFIEFLGAVCLHSDTEKVLYRLHLQAQHLNSFGLAHGGLLQSLQDAAMAQLARNLHHGQKAALTLQMQTYFLEAAAGLGDEIQVEARLLHSSLTLVVCEAFCYSQQTTVARSTAQFKLVRSQHQRNSKPG